MYSSEYLKLFVMSKASLLELCHGEKKYETFSISENNKSLLSDCRTKNFRANESIAQTCLSYAECSRKSLVCKMYVIVNKQVKFLTSQYIGTCKSAYTKGYTPN